MPRIHPSTFSIAEDNKYSDFLKLFEFIKRYGFPHIIEEVKPKYKHCVTKMREKAETIQARNKNVSEHK